MTTISVYRTKNSVPTNADVGTLTVNNAAGTELFANLPIIPDPAGVYQYSFTAQPPGRYEATWRFFVAAQPDDIVRQLFEVEPVLSASAGIALLEIEREVAARVGPYQKLTARGDSSINGLVCGRLRSTLGIGDYEDLYLLRRGRLTNGEQVDGFTADDRVRVVASYNNTTGTLVPDWPWALQPLDGEVVELHYLHPEDQLRPAVVAGLRRCFYEETVLLTATEQLAAINLTALAPWITQPRQVRDVTIECVAGWGQESHIPYRVSQRGGAVMLQLFGRWVVASGSVVVHALRPHSSLVNGEASRIGPDDDDDLLSVERIYATRAGHVSAWELYPDRLTPVAAQGLAWPAKQVADAFTLASLAAVKPTPDRIQVDFWGRSGYDQVGNAGGTW